MTKIVIGEHSTSGDPPRAPALPEVAQAVEAPASTSVRLGGGSFCVPLVAVLVSLVAGALLIRLQVIGLTSAVASQLQAEQVVDVAPS